MFSGKGSSKPLTYPRVPVTHVVGCWAIYYMVSNPLFRQLDLDSGFMVRVYRVRDFVLK